MGTPTSRDYKGVPGDNVQMASLPRDVSLLPTPNATDRKGSNTPIGRERDNRGHMITRHEGDANLPAIVALLPTPMTINSTSKKAQEERPTSGPHRGDPSYGLEDVVSLLPTPNAADSFAGDIDVSPEGIERQLRRGDPEGSLRNTTGSLAKEVKLLPTPNTLDDMPPKTREQIQAHRDKGLGGDRNLREYVLYELPAEAHAHVESRWGRYEPAIRRWENVLQRAAPEPVEPSGKDGAQRLSPAFTEFMMGLPAGWVTDTGISRKGQLHALGNGVVVQQCELALRILLQRMNNGI